MKALKGRVRAVCAVAVCLLWLGAAPAQAQTQASPASDAGYGTLAGLTSIVYAPIKIIYALGGFLAGGFAWAVSAGDRDVWDAVVTPAVRGDYVVTPSNLRGEEPLEFIGRRDKF